MGQGFAAPTLYSAPDASFPRDIQPIYSYFLEDKFITVPFTSSLFRQPPDSVVREFEWPDGDMVVDILTNPALFTDHSNPRDALLKLIFPLFLGPDETQPYLHQILLQYFEFAKQQYLAFRSKKQEKCDLDFSRRAELHRILIETNTQVPSGLSTESLSALNSISTIQAFLAEKSQRVRSPFYEPVTTFLNSSIRDVASADCALDFAFSLGDISTVLHVIKFMLTSAADQPLRRKYTRASSWLSSLPVESLPFVPLVAPSTQSEDFSHGTHCLASNGRYLFLSESKGQLSLYLRGRKLSDVSVSKKDLLFGIAGDFLYVADGERAMV
jgi:hypothetical protein